MEEDPRIYRLVAPATQNVAGDQLAFLARCPRCNAGITLFEGDITECGCGLRWHLRLQAAALLTLPQAGPDGGQHEQKSRATVS